MAENSSLKHVSQISVFSPCQISCGRKVLPNDFETARKMRMPKPKFEHSAAVYQAIIAEHRDSEMKMAERLRSCGWTLADAAWAAVNWDLRTLAAAIANERARRKSSLTNLSDVNLAKLKVETEETKKSPLPSPTPRKTNRIKTNRIPTAAPQLRPSDPTAGSKT